MQWWNWFIGIPFKNGGRDRDGCDCWGLVCFVYLKMLKVTLPEYGHCAHATKENAALIGEHKADWQEVHDPKNFDIVILKPCGLPSHVGLIVDGGGYFLHCMQGVNSVIEPLNSVRWKNRIDSYWRFTA